MVVTARLGMSAILDTLRWSMVLYPDCSLASVSLLDR